VSGSGRVIASSSADILPGEVLGPGRLSGAGGRADRQSGADRQRAFGGQSGADRQSAAGWPGTMTAAGPPPRTLLGGRGGPGAAEAPGGPGAPGGRTANAGRPSGESEAE